MGALLLEIICWCALIRIVKVVFHLISAQLSSLRLKRMAQQRTVALPSSIEADGNTEENQETRLFFFEYMSRRAEKDAEISTSDAELIKEQRHQQAIPTGGKDAALEVASRLAALGIL